VLHAGAGFYLLGLGQLFNEPEQITHVYQPGAALCPGRRKLGRPDFIARHPEYGVEGPMADPGIRAARSPEGWAAPLCCRNSGLLGIVVHVYASRERQPPPPMAGLG